MTWHGFDPGKTTGYARWSPVHGHLAWEVQTWQAFVNVSTDIHYQDSVVYEDFVPRPGVRTFQPDPLHVIGGIRYQCQRSNVTPLPVQAGASKGLVSNDDLKALGWYRPRLGHANDASRVLLAGALLSDLGALSEFVREGLRAAAQH